MRHTLAIALSLSIACSSGKKTTPTAAAVPAPASPAAAAPSAAPDTLYARLGGKPAITAVVDEFVGRTTTDPRIMDRFFNTDAIHLKAMLVDQICAATGGPCAYHGRDMKSTHGGMVLVGDEFDALVEDLTAALDKFHVGAREKGELLGALAGMKPDIVAPASDLHPIDDAALAPATKLGASLKDAEAARLVGMAVTAAHRGQRSYAEQLFSRAELRVGAGAVASIAPIFRASAPPHVATATTRMPMDTPPQPRGAVGGSDEAQARGGARLTGAIFLGAHQLDGVGVVMLEPEKGGWKARTPKQRIVEQRGRAFAPHLLATPVGSTVAFPNFDSIFHNVFSLSAAGHFDLGLYRNGETREVTFNKEGVVRVGCNLHSDMSAFIIVVSSPHYAVTDAAGTFTFQHLAPGKYKLKAWSEHTAAPRVTEIDVAAGDNHTVVTLDADAPANNPDKFGDAR